MSTASVVFLLFFGIYGFIHMIMHGIIAFRAERSFNSISSHRVLLIHNGAEHIEGMIRSLAWQEIPEDIVAVTLGSTDETPEILRNLDEEYSFLTTMTEYEYLEYIREQKEFLLINNKGDNNV